MNNESVKGEIAKAMPAVGVSALTVLGVPLSEWDYILTIIYLMAQIGWLGLKIWKHLRG
jgi:hypothetical protein